MMTLFPRIFIMSYLNMPELIDTGGLEKKNTKTRFFRMILETQCSKHLTIRKVFAFGLHSASSSAFAAEQMSMQAPGLSSGPAPFQLP